MSTLTNLPPDNLILILKQLRWRDIYNVCQMDRRICQHPRVQEFVLTRLNKITDEMVNEIRSMRLYLELISLNPVKKYIVSHLRWDKSSYFLTEEEQLSIKLTHHTPSLISNSSNLLDYGAKSKSKVRVTIEELRRIINYLLSNGLIDEGFNTI